MDRTKLDRAIIEIREYTEKHLELRTAHHFLYDLPSNKSLGTPNIVVLGINPGETEYDKRNHPQQPTEETWLYDFQENGNLGRARGSRNWFDCASYFAGGQSVVFSELFFWSSNNQVDLKNRYGPVWRSRHLDFCTRKNKLLLTEYQPRAVIFVGISDAEKVAGLFALRHANTVKDGTHRLVEHYQDNARPWFFTKHWSGSYGFLTKQKESIKQYIDNILK